MQPGPEGPPSRCVHGESLGLQLAAVQKAGEQRGPWQQWQKVLGRWTGFRSELQPPAAITGVGWAVVSLQVQLMWWGRLDCHTDPGLGRA